MISVLIADDSLIFQKGLRAVIEQDKDITVVGCAENGLEAFEMCKKLSPDIILMDIKMPGYDGVEGTRLIKEANLKTKVLILTTFDDSENIRRAIDNGAFGYILKDVMEEDINLILKNVYKGYNVLQEQVFKNITECENKPVSRVNQVFSAENWNFSERELEIIKMLVDGRDYREMAEKIFVTEGTIRNTISSLLTRLNLKDRTQLAVFAVKNNII